MLLLQIRIILKYRQVKSWKTGDTFDMTKNFFHFQFFLIPKFTPSFHAVYFPAFPHENCMLQ